MRNTKKAANKKQSKIKFYMLAPFRVLSKARDFYMKGMEDCLGKLGYSGVMGGPSAPISHLPKSFSVNSSMADDDEDLRQLLRTVSKKRDAEASQGLGLDLQRQRVVRKQANVGYYGGMGRSYSVGLGKIGRIDEDKPCNFEEEDVSVLADVYTRSRSYAV